MTDSDIDIVKQTAALARLEITDDEAARLGPQFRRILESLEALTALDLDGVDAMTRGGGDETVLRADEPRPSLPTQDLVSNAPERVDDFYSVPKTIGGAE